MQELVAVDIHTHAIPLELCEVIRDHPDKMQARIERDSEGNEIIRHDQGYCYPLYKGFYDPQARLADMDKRQIHTDVMSVSPTMYYYWLDSETCAEISRLCNDAMARMASACPSRLKAAATVPMQDVEAAVRELKRVVERHGMKMVSIGTSVEGKNLDATEFLPFFKLAEELGVVILFHPYYVGARRELQDYYLTNIVGNPLETAVCIARLILGGVLEQCPRLKLVFVHGGGFLPYQWGRVRHGYSVRQEPKVVVKGQSLDKYLSAVHFDTITHWVPALEFLGNSYGWDKVLLGSDYPFDMADPDPVKTVMALNADETAKLAVLEGNAARLLGTK
ncbi:MAG: amidohydrolase family protein [Bacillota bacterium]